MTVADSIQLDSDAIHLAIVQGVLAPMQFVVFLISLALVLRYGKRGNRKRRDFRPSHSARRCRK